MTNDAKPYHHGDLKNALIRAGTEILAREGVAGLSLRKVAKQAGVSHAAPYAHFADKQSLIAAISTEGFRQLDERVRATREAQATSPTRLLEEVAWAYLQFALEDPDRFKIMFSSILEKEKEYPEFVDMSQKTFQQVVEVIEKCQEAGILRKETVELMAVTIWGAVHGMVMLLLEGQISRRVQAQFSLREMVQFLLAQFTRE
ncbi:MAG TPA: TetR/AcrR family transcriptional regulator [Anaerolineales bacterium]|nr:TetR/AcrR family transcriptional regulator [Anaerolineales bacterium]